ncbi:hypothetical protein MM2B1231_2847 [Mycobacteroides abscessus subsp. bolletii 2B-1231]|nr:hypothetical protein MM1S1530915_2408 [Mycobacteroides abscessus subsp. bolletii 1S-153-0915]EIV11983.1 hypothetical protein MM2B0912R_3184 [Mycobacteroides abscessus subsp. bolletii 2B-0912-R]EIV75386.1 hypothetical protein MM2B1231_2847 [Mycobacteroides abscessus subsp. bolletii 2B-1231]ETZ77632.1 hypothetical protein L831_2798 [Mycobacteroides abscessus MAB_082312_2272]ETZ82489.1 hypothetical protein L834_2721 [Mycobacteroides abscessus MAB_091912_2455]
MLDTCGCEVAGVDIEALTSAGFVMPGEFEQPAISITATQANPSRIISSPPSLFHPYTG